MDAGIPSQLPLIVFALTLLWIGLRLRRPTR
jgi:hypothetical protein